MSRQVKIRLLVIVALLVTLVGFSVAVATPAHADCGSCCDSPSGQIANVNCCLSNTVGSPATSCVTTTPTPVPAPACAFGDARINCRDAFQNVAIYCPALNTIALWPINLSTGAGGPEIDVTPAQIAAVPSMPTKDTLIVAEKDGIKVYRLTDGTIKVTMPYPSGDLYTFVWTGC